MHAAEVLVGALALYAAFGLAFALAFVSVGIGRLDAEARGASIGFRLIVAPGVAALWPVLFTRWIHGRTEPPIERNPHRAAAGAGGAR